MLLRHALGANGTWRKVETAAVQVVFCLLLFYTQLIQHTNSNFFCCSDRRGTVFNSLLTTNDALNNARAAVIRMVMQHSEQNGVQTQRGTSSKEARYQLLTEQLIRYTPTDRYFAPHLDKVGHAKQCL